MKKLVLALLLIVASVPMNAQIGLKGDMNNDGKIDLTDVTAIVNVIVGKSPAEIINVFEVDNGRVAGTWYAPDGSRFIFNADGTTDFQGGSTFEFIPILGQLVVYDAANNVVKTMKITGVTDEYLREESTINGELIYYVSSPYMVTDITLSQTSLSMRKGATYQLVAAISPTNATDKSVAWTSSNTSVISVDAYGLVTAIGVGSCVITCTAQDGSGISATCTVTAIKDDSGSIGGRDYVDLDLPSGTLWATCNVGASSPEECGGYFAWGETTPYLGYDASNARNHQYNLRCGREDYQKWTFMWQTYKFSNDGNSYSFTKYCHISSYGNNNFTDTRTELEVDDDAAHVRWGQDWRMPSEDQFSELADSEYTTWVWTTQNEINGMLITSKSNGNSIFLPVTGSRLDVSLYAENSNGSYWSRSLCTEGEPTLAWALGFNNRGSTTNGQGRLGGRCIRAVRNNQ